MSETPNVMKPIIIGVFVLLLFYYVIPACFSLMAKKDADGFRGTLTVGQGAPKKHNAKPQQ